MILEILTYAGLTFAGIFLFITLVNMIGGPFLKKVKPSIPDPPKVSVLIPARNEGHKIGRCLQSLSVQNYPDLEIIVLDDGSTDSTAAEVRKFANVTLISGKPLPPDWLGKNWACKQLAERAVGEVLIFADADTWQAPDAVSKTVAWMAQKKIDMLSAFPQQIMNTLWEKISIPFMDLILYAHLPLWLTLYSRSAKLAAANGQWIAFRKDPYLKIGGHAAVKSRIVEDVELARLAKSAGFRILTISGAGAVYCRMYTGFGEIRAGFEKNLYGLTGSRTPLFFTLFLIMLLAYILPVITIFIPSLYCPAAVCLLIQALIRLSLAVRLKHPLLLGTFLAPVTVIIGMLIGISSFYKTKRGLLRWKDRKIYS